MQNPLNCVLDLATRVMQASQLSQFYCESHSFRLNLKVSQARQKISQKFLLSDKFILIDLINNISIFHDSC